MRNLMKFGIVLVVLAMVTSTAFAANRYIGPNPGSWCVATNWSKGYIPSVNDGQKVEIRGSDVVIIDICSPAGCAELEMRDTSTLQVGTSIANGDAADLKVRLDIKKDLEMSDDSGKGDDTTLDIVNGDVYVGDRSSDMGEDGDIHVIVAAGSSLTFEDGMKLGDSNDDGCDNTYVLDIAGDFANNGDRFQVYGGTLTINLTGDGTFYTDETTRLSRKKDARTIVNITDDAAFLHDKDIEIGSDKSGQDCPPSLEINISGNGTWDGSNKGKDIEYKKDGQSVVATITDNGSLIVKNFGENGDAKLTLVVDGAGASFEVTEDLDVGQGTIEIIDGEFTVGRRFDLGIDGDADMTVEADGVVDIDDRLRMGKEGNNADLTINGCRVDVGELEMGSNSRIEINGDGEVVVKDADDQDDWDDLNALVAGGQITTSNPGMVIVTDYNVSHSGRFTLQPAIAVDVDIKPGGCPNPLRVNFRGSGVFTVAIVGEPGGFDVSTVDVGTVTLAGVSALRGKMGDVSTYDVGNGCTDLGPDGTPDLVLKFNRADILDALEATYGEPLLRDLPNRAELSLALRGESTGGPIAGDDSLVILNRGAIKRRR